MCSSSASGALLYSVCTIGIGLLISIVTRTQLAAMLVTFLATVTPAFNYSGFITPVGAMDAIGQFIAQFIPATLLHDVVRGSYHEGPRAWRSTGRSSRRSPSIRRWSTRCAGCCSERGSADVGGGSAPWCSRSSARLAGDVPILFILLWGFTGAVFIAGRAISMDLNNYPVAVLDLSRSTESRELIARLRPPYFKVVARCKAMPSSTDALDRGRASLGGRHPADVRARGAGRRRAAFR